MDVRHTLLEDSWNYQLREADLPMPVVLTVTVM